MARRKASYSDDSRPLTKGEILSKLSEAADYTDEQMGGRTDKHFYFA